MDRSKASGHIVVLDYRILFREGWEWLCISAVGKTGISLSLDAGFDVALDPRHNIYVKGYTYSTDFPIVRAFQSNHGGFIDGFVTKLDSQASDVQEVVLRLPRAGGKPGGDRHRILAVRFGHTGNN